MLEEFGVQLFIVRERFAVAKSKGSEDPFVTSSHYQKSGMVCFAFLSYFSCIGQIGKDYLGYLLQSPGLKRKYTLLFRKLGYLYSDVEVRSSLC